MHLLSLFEFWWVSSIFFAIGWSCRSLLLYMHDEQLEERYRRFQEGGRELP